ncbi:hypothetical protein F2Q70_00029664 [Brassica cretica]|uniref:NYN domain-containing protein n=1 Tax=Brassica cretica TaxID=69181 RepID=A0A8S9FDZ4_BRACR|nr:hypothetical protein F2Q70_00029664 [Brassica cretica]
MSPTETAIVSVDSFASDFNLMAATQRREAPLAVLWDIENCPVPSDVRPEDVASNIRTAIQLHPVVSGSVVVFSAFGDFNAFPRRVREGCQRTGVKLVDVPNGRKDAADKAILLDMFLFVLDHPPPSTIVIITGDVDFAPALHVLGQRGYNVVVIIPSGVYVNPALTSAGKFVWDWQSIVHGEGIVKSLSHLQDPSLCIRSQPLMMIQKAMSPTETAIVSVDSFASDFNLMAATQRREAPLAVLWDIENCPVPSDVRPEDVASNIRTAIQLHPVVSGSVVVFSAFGDFNAFPRRVREGCQRTGVKLVDVPNGRKDAADKAILLDMFLFVLDHPPPSTIVIITGDVDFAPALHVLGQRGYNVVVIIPSGVYVNPALTSAGSQIAPISPQYQECVHHKSREAQGLAFLDEFVQPHCCE